MTSKRAISATAVLLVIALATIGCATKTGVGSVAHPNQISAFDGWAYDSLIVAQGALTQAKVEVIQFPTAKPILNEAIAAYNTAVAGYKIYHTTGGGDTTQLTNQINDLISRIARLQQSFGGSL